MGQLMFYLAAVVACLLWSAAFTAAAARTRPGWVRMILLVVAVSVPVLSLAPWVGWTATLAFGARLEANWFAPTITAFLSALVGGVWIARKGLTPRATPAAATWPIVGLATGFVLAKACAFGTLLFIDNAVAAEGRMLRVEAAQVIAAALPPAPWPDNNAAPLYQRALAALAADKQVDEAESLTDAGSPEVTAILARHAATLELLRRATDKPGCRFDRDWSRPSIGMPLPEIQEMRRAARLLMISARRAAANGDGEQAIADVVRIHRLGMHAASEPLLVSGLVGQKIDAVAIQTLADVLPRLDPDDLPLLERESFRNFLETPITWCQRAFLGEEAFGLATLGDLADEVNGATAIELLQCESSDAWIIFNRPFSLLYRCFLLPADIVGYRGIMRKYETLLAAAPPSQRFPDLKKQTDDIEHEIESHRPGSFASMLTPALSNVLKSQARGEALHVVAGLLVAATRARLMGTPLADSLVPDAVPALPGDPFTAEEPLRWKRDGDALLVYSVGPDGEDDGGPVPPGAEPVQGNDDVGLRMSQGG
jgi:hypothetical protein